MAASSRLARLQQGLAAGLLVAALAWFAYWVGQRPLLAAFGAGAIACVHAVVLGLEFLFLLHVRRADPAPRAGAGQLLAAWGRETLQGLRVFGWRQPFRWRRWPDRLEAGGGRRGIVFVHGFVCNRGFWAPWLARARQLGHPYVAVNLEPVFGSIDDYAQSIDAAVRQLTAASGRPPVLVCHSMGGLAARAWLRAAGRPERVAHVVTIATPHHGTALARFSRLPNGRQMRIGGEWLDDLSRAAGLPASRFTCWFSNCDNVVMPPSTATLAGADNRFLPGAAHVDLAFRETVVEGTFALVRDL
ncbi:MULTISPECIES: esterase/lipase family protein [Ramlibacter]|uniref:Alpha/beta fold hydrolase n=1 Tax=Ramlibacter pinisoli TaxID=2682844 RepID=A0A6N8J143_9BURK|nr:MULTISPECIES: alpha/beta fold hydrolase [Ramlibacter]MBA2962816.1 alpha/beta fold hydrolase [Ramlibacter sp. CGMCC 1.13660]MVQ32758.1 alpha/beta fold hydrolase [Ramlibacter pinisoli]